MTIPIIFGSGVFPTVPSFSLLFFVLVFSLPSVHFHSFSWCSLGSFIDSHLPPRVVESGVFRLGFAFLSFTFLPLSIHLSFSSSFFFFLAKP